MHKHFALTGIVCAALLSLAGIATCADAPAITPDSEQANAFHAMLKSRDKIKTGVVQVEITDDGRIANYLIAFDYNTARIRFDRQVKGKLSSQIISTSGDLHFRGEAETIVRRYEPAKWPETANLRFIDPRSLGLGGYGDHAWRLPYAALCDLLEKSRLYRGDDVSWDVVPSTMYFARTTPIDNSERQARRLDHCWVDVSRDYVPVQYEIYAQSYNAKSKRWLTPAFDSATTTKWEESNEVFVPTSVSVIRGSRNNKPILEMVLDWESVNKEIPDHYFDPKSIELGR